MIIPTRIDAVALYGSQVRGDRDRFSDRDLLLVSDDPSALSEAKTLMSKNGFSSACYSWKKLRFLTNRKALFVQHLKQESQIIIDKENKLHSLLASYRPASNYFKQIEGARDLVSLTDCFPHTRYGIGWALDVLAVGFRNLSILSLANEGKYVFSFSGILSELRKMKMIDSEEAVSLLALREYKSHFRTKAYSLLPSKERVIEIKKIIGNVFDIDPHATSVSENFFYTYCLHSSLALKSSHWYLRARLYEGAFLALKQMSQGIDLDTSLRLKAIEDAVSNPGCYNALFLNSSENLRLEILDLAERFQLKAAA
jgi:hypothetical protein